MHNFETAVQTASGIPARVLLKEESRTSKCPHGRYLVTDQAAILVDRGFDLLWDDARMLGAGLTPATDPRPIRDVAVVLCSDCNAVDSQTRLLPAF
jgi:hypothetical protein